MSENVALHPSVLTDEDFASLAFILGAYLGTAIKNCKEEEKDPLTDPVVERAREMTSKLLDKLRELQNTQ